MPPLDTSVANDTCSAPARARCLDAALDYASRGFSVILLHGIVDGRCTCGKPDCNGPGKHPIGTWKRAQTERVSAEEIEAVFRKHPHANLGIVTGEISGLVVVDLDGEEGFASCIKISPDGPLELPTVRTGNGYHLYARHPGTKLKNFVKNHPGLDGRADGGYVVAPPSIHVSGREYSWTRGLEDPLPDLPPDLLALFSSSESRSEQPARQKAKVNGTDEPQTPEPAATRTLRVPAALTKYAETALANECGLVAAAPIGQQEGTLSTAGLKIGRYVGASLLDFATARDALIDAGLRMENDPKRSRWMRAEICVKVDAKLRIGMNSPKWGRDPRGDDEDQSPPLEIFGDTALAGSPAFPLDALPSALEGFVADRAERLGVDPAMIAMPALAVCAAALDDCYVVQVHRYDQQWVERARLWVAIVEEPGGKKTPAIAAAVEPAREIENEWLDKDTPKLAQYGLELDVYHEERKKAAKLPEVERQCWSLFSSEPVKPAVRRFVVSDTTTEQLARILAENPAGVMGVFDELTQLLGSFDAYRGPKASGRDRAIWLQLYNGGPTSIDRVGSGLLRVPNWSASVVGGIQPELMRKLMPNLSEDGLLQRFIPIFGSGPSRGVDRVADENADRAYRGLLRTIVGWRGLPTIKVMLSPEAHDARERVMERVTALQMLPDTPGPLKTHLGKWEALFARLLLTMHAIEVASLGAIFGLSLEQLHEISGSTARRVEKLMIDYLLPNAMRFYSEFYGRSEHIEHAFWVAGHILAHRLPVITARDVGRAYNALRADRQTLDRTMSYLELAGWVIPMTDEKTKRPTRWWVDPRVHQLFAERAEQERTRRARDMQKIRDAAAKLGRVADHGC